ncbi:MAG: sulfite exporter TauE/SafE family protein [Acidobacteria bacterium]|nr:MAG: sulfite exporter TauE/SafE family protein [Acidobacteriota bacterium]
MFETLPLLLAVAFFAAAVLYSSVGHAGASGYLAVMAFAGMPAPMMRPTALVLNLLVASIATFRFARAGFFSWKLFWPFALGSIPLAFVGGAISLPGHWYRTLVGIVLWAAAARLALNLSLKKAELPPKPIAIGCGAGIGLLAGLTGTGGGIFLSPLLLFMGWAETRQTGGVAAAFILVNSAAGLAGNPGSLGHLPAELPLWATAAVVGGLIGADLGSRRIGTPTFRRLLAAVLVVAGVKLIFS